MERSRPFESADTVNRVVALLVRVPELHSVRANPADATLTLSYAVRARLDRVAVKRYAAVLTEHVEAFGQLRGEEPVRVAVAGERDGALTFLHVTRDAASFGREELELQVALLVDRFGAAVVRNAVDAPLDEDSAAREETLESALDALRDPGRAERLVGFRDDSRVLVYFLHGRRRGARARS